MLLFAAYAASGFAALIDEVVWTRLVTLRLGHTTAAASTVLAAFMGGLSIGAALGGRVAPRVSRQRARHVYAALELVVILSAATVWLQLEALTPILRWAYADGTAGAAFVFMRSAAVLAILGVPAIALGATFPFAVHAASAQGRVAPTLYAVNTAGAAAGAVAAGFVLVPLLGTIGAMLSGIVASTVSMVLVLAAPDRDVEPRGVRIPRAQPAAGRRDLAVVSTRPALAVWMVVFLTGGATFVFEVAWTRLLALLAGPSTYAFAAIVALCIAGLAAGSLAGAGLAVRLARPAAAFAVVVAATAAAGAASHHLVSGLPRLMAVASLGRAQRLSESLWMGLGWMALAALPVMVLLGTAFPLALTIVERTSPSRLRALGTTAAVSSVAGVAGALAAGSWLLPAWGAEGALRIAVLLLVAASCASVVSLSVPHGWRAASICLSAAALAAAVRPAPWDHALMASGAYKYSADLPAGADLDVALLASRLLFYRDGAAATVSVKEAAGVRSLSIDGKVDASNGSDMLTQKLLAHLPLLLHPAPKNVAIVGLGSGVTLGAALTHPVERVDVVELSPEVVEASRHFERDNRQALADPRTRLLIADGRSHLRLSSRRYDVIVSEPSNPWMAGVAALFTREFLEEAKTRLAPGGVLCQWAHTYDIGNDDLRSIAATFKAVFPGGTMWLVGEGDLLFLGSDAPLDARLVEVAAQWRRPGVAADLASVHADEPFALLTMYVGGPDALSSFAAAAPVQRDRWLALEFSGPYAVNAVAPDSSNVTALLDLQRTDGWTAPVVAQALATAGAAEWRSRGETLFGAGAYALAYDADARAIRLDPGDVTSALRLLDAASAADRLGEAAALLAEARTRHPESVAATVALSRLRASAGDVRHAIELAQSACLPPHGAVEACDQLASIYMDVGETGGLEATVALLEQRHPLHASTLYASAALAFAEGRYADAERLAGRVLAVDGKRAPVWNLLGAARAVAGHTDAARTAFQSALKLAPRDQATLLNLARLETEASRRDEAARLFALALTLDPSSSAARDGLADVLADVRRR